MGWVADSSPAADAEEETRAVGTGTGTLLQAPPLRGAGKQALGAARAGIGGRGLAGGAGPRPSRLGVLAALGPLLRQGRFLDPRPA